MLERRSALSKVLSRPGTAAPAHEPGVTLSERRPLTILQVSAFATTIDTAAANLTSAGLATPAANRMSGDDTICTRSIGPGIWQIVGSPHATPGAAALRDGLRGVATVVDLSHARSALRIAGPDAVRTLAKHCPLDLDPRQFPTGSATNTRFGHLGVTLARVDDRPTFELLVFRGYAEFVAEMLCEAAVEFGLAIR
jgi:sarcosine oxidase subunit gamma